ncbi:hypothetical protein [Nannocystis radixulma]|uniref:Uncharacterized protein n=1 Tax=Nannocystis radixulma TaxID=2995305 RepID=A0ABT5B317_9BACT|nr:hypothetical protein [Nannocystis radixulma]MDC0668495.1 hypothetical protein [Nannocystis radixulma]
MRLPLAAAAATLLAGCLSQNPAYDGPEAGSDGTGEAPPTTSGAATTAGTSSGASTTGAVEGTNVLMGMSEATETTGHVESTTTADGPLTCPGEEVQLGPLAPVRDAFFITSAGDHCPWQDSDLMVMNSGLPCAQQNYGQTIYATVGATAEGRSEYVVEFGVAAAMQAHPDMAIASATLAIVPWWASDRQDIVFAVGVVASDDVWVEGNKNAAMAAVGDSSWEYRWIDGPEAKYTWSSGQGPASGSTPAATIELGPLIADSHEYRASTPIAGALLASWLADPGTEQGLVLSTAAAPVLVKSMQADPVYVPLLSLTLCPAPAGGG